MVSKRFRDIDDNSGKFDSAKSKIKFNKQNAKQITNDKVKIKFEK